uniref:E3 ubiquitin-protein ligase n=1 Tax=Graphocephala atropunctata TaxID=36148 RepID=A0A1B6MLV4_9HEMI
MNDCRNAMDSNEKLKQIYTSVRKTLECHMCLNTLEVPFKLCARGHGICKRCIINNAEKCPTCDGKLTLENPSCVMNLLEALSGLCRHSCFGCTEFVVLGGNHERTCAYRPVSCRVGGCRAVVSVCGLMDHFGLEHRGHRIITSVDATTMLPNYNVKHERNDALPGNLFGQVFWITFSNDLKKKQLKFCLQSMPVGTLKEDFYVCIVFNGEKFGYSYNLKASVLSTYRDVIREHVCGHKGYNDEQICGLCSRVNISKDEICIRVPQVFLNRLGKNGNLHFKLHFFQKSSE